MSGTDGPIRATTGARWLRFISNVGCGHLDSTSLHTDGAYAGSDADDDEPVIRVTHGYSRDHRPDLKQIVTRFICENQAGIPVFMKSLSGNSNDQTDFRVTVKTHIEGLKEGNGLKRPSASSI
jgi:transposase